MLQLKVKKEVDSELLFQMDMELEQGLYVISGENGCGKSTLLNCISGLDKEYSGSVTYDGQELLASEVCYIMQTPSLFNELNCYDNFKCLIGEEKAVDLDYILELLDFRKVFYSKRKVSKLSGGELQKLNIVINCAKNCKVYLIDEIENNLDAKTREVLPDIVKRLSGIVLIATHHLDAFAELVNYQLAFENRCVSKRSVRDSYQLGTSSNIPNKSKLEKKDIKSLGKFNVYNRILIGIILLITILITATVINKVVYSFQYMKRPAENFVNNSMVVVPPINSELYDAFGDESWLKKTMANFNEEDYQYFKSLDGVETISSIPSISGSAGSYSYYTKDEVYSYENTLNYQTLDYKKYGLEQYSRPDVAASVSLQNLVYPYDLATNTPYMFNAIQGDMLYGNYPQDSTNQVLIDVYTAIYLAGETNSSNIKDIIGTTVNIPLTGDKKQENKQFTVSGIYVPAEKVSESINYVSYDPQAEIVQRNNCSLYPDKKSDEYKRCLVNDAELGPEAELSADQIKQIGDYSGFYLTATDSNAEKKIYKAIKEYDPYIYIDSNYGRSQSTSFVYFKMYYIKLMITMLLTISLFGLIVYGLKKLMEVEFEKIDKTLREYSFADKEIMKVKRQEYRYLNLMYAGFIVIFIIFQLIMYGFDIGNILLTALINGGLIIIMNNIFNGSVKWRRK